MTLKTRIPPPILALAAVLLMVLADRFLPLLRWLEWPWKSVGFAVMAIGFALDGWAIALFLHAQTTVNPMHPESSSKLVVTGLYRLSRNPMYLGLMIALSGGALLLGSLAPFPIVLLFAWALVVLQIRPEEAALERRFGDAYLLYKRQVGRWFGWSARPPDH